MHTLVLGTHIAVLEPDTGLGVLVLPQPVYRDDHLTVNGEAATTIARRWFGPHTQPYSAAVHHLNTLGWQLPRNDHTASAWFDAGTTTCCGRQLISLICPAVKEVPLPRQILADTAQHVANTAASACCGL